jgi:predicted RNase H-like HicB family nuclease
MGHNMLLEYIEAALSQAEYKVIENDEPYFASVPDPPGVWATGNTIEEYRKELIEVIEEWIVARLQRGLSIPPMGEHTIGVSEEPVAIV